MKDNQTIIRVAIFPIAEIVGSDWKTFRAEALHPAWQDSTALSNWAMQELATRDVRRKIGDTKLGPMPKIDLYNIGFTKKGFWGVDQWELCKSSATCVLRRVDRAYRSKRFAILWRGSMSFPSFRYPQPYPVHNANWKAELVEGKPHVVFNMKGQSWRLRLKSGPEFARQMKTFRQIVNGAKKCELTIYKQREHTMVKMACHVPKPEAKSGQTLLVRTDTDAFLVAELEGRQAWILNADHIRRWIASHKAYLQRISEDTKREKRWPAKMKRNIQKVREARCEKQNNRLDSWCHEVSAMILGFAQRNGCGTIIYDDVLQTYFPSFPWFSLRGKLEYKCNAVGIKLVHRGAEDEAA